MVYLDNFFVFQTVPCGRRRRSHFSPWFIPSTSNRSKWLKTTKRYQPNNHTEIRSLQKSCEDILECDWANFETKLSDTRYRSQLFNYIGSFKKHCILTSILYRVEFTTASKSQNCLFSKYSASVFTVAGLHPNGRIPFQITFAWFQRLWRASST